MLGLERYTVELVDYDPEWDSLAKDRCDFIRRNCHEFVVDVQHIGSTSIPDIPAKPVLDIAVGVPVASVIEDLKLRLISLGYVYRGIGSGSSGHFFVGEFSPDVRTEHLHVNLVDSAHWNNQIVFRDTLRSNAALRREYAALKTDLERRLDNDRKAYTQGKDEFID